MVHHPQRAATPGWKPLLDEILILCISSMQWRSLVFMVEETTKQLERREKHRMCFFYVRKKWSLYVLLAENRHLRPTFLCNKRVLQHIQYFFSKFCSSWLEVWHVLKENYGANVWNLKSCIGLYTCYVTETFSVAGSNSWNGNMSPSHLVTVGYLLWRN